MKKKKETIEMEGITKRAKLVEKANEKYKYIQEERKKKN